MATRSTPAHDVSGAVAVAMLRETVLAARRASRDASAVLAREGASLDEWMILDVLGDEDGLTMSQLRESLLVDKATLGRRVDALVTRALVYREVDGVDRRVIRVYLSSRGRDVLARLTTRLAAQHEHADAPDDDQ
ncbi:DNA-binding MarR family transcriptional regulator [Isoptericola jiangsuensis]|uniref:DNA-binding MarR family transcriptional regulator n=1 Tax=Isoptericola jiangsuensis TaxID=548579 RepID=A0A2A9ETM8_9MICO|nr:MarR family transcriptional regulator [Isoptericola jiangsuensis]PFG42248.1 DNA-binding MarR family transcriptional regulator [Isoptericola jiangsuensis]